MVRSEVNGCVARPVEEPAGKLEEISEKLRKMLKVAGSCGKW